MVKTVKKLSVSILSLSLLTVMAGAAIAPALDVLQAHFSDVNPTLVQMTVSMPAVFIVLGNMIFPKLTERLKVKTLTMIGLLLYVIGGCAAGAFDNIWIILMMRAFIGLGVGIIMPLSTGLLSFYFPPEKIDKLMGYSSAMNMMGGVIATLLTGVLSGISWRCSFLVYLIGLLSIILCILFFPNDKINSKSKKENTKSGTTFKTYWAYIAGMFFIMMTFFIYPTNFAMIVISDGIIPHNYIAPIMAMMDFFAFMGGLSFANLRRKGGKNVGYITPVFLIIGYVLMISFSGWPGVIVGSIFIGFANGIGTPFIISEVSAKAGQDAVTTVIPMISMALYLAQFFCPLLTSVLQNIFGGGVHFPYFLAVGTAAILFMLSFVMNRGNTVKK